MREIAQDHIQSMAAKGNIVMTVTGPISPDTLGVTLTHEHLHITASSFFTPPERKFQSLALAPIELRNLGWIRQHPYSHKLNLSIDGEGDEIKEEMLIYKENGGSSLVENTTIGINRNIGFLKRVSEETGIKIISGTGFYCENYQKEAVKGYSEEKMEEMIRSDLVEGVNGVKCGVIGEVGCSWPLTDFEKRSLRSAGSTQAELGCPVIIHPGRNPKSPSEIMRIFSEAGGKAEHTVMSHLDRTFIDNPSLLEFAKEGTYLEYDLFGTEVSDYQLDLTIDMPSDGQRIGFIKTLVDNGLEDRVVIAHDIHTKHRLVKYGGHGYSHILLNVIPKMLDRGISQEQVNKILKHNPKTWLTWI